MFDPDASPRIDPRFVTECYSYAVKPAIRLDSPGNPL